MSHELMSQKLMVLGYSTFEAPVIKRAEISSKDYCITQLHIPVGNFWSHCLQIFTARLDG